MRDCNLWRSGKQACAFTVSFSGRESLDRTYITLLESYIFKWYDMDIAYPEGPLLHNGTLYYVDYRHGTLHSIGETENVFLINEKCGPCGLAYFLPQDELVVACYDSQKIIFIKSKHEMTLPYPNDMICDVRGGLFITSSATYEHNIDPFHPTSTPSGSIYYLHPIGTLSKLPGDPIHYANGIGIHGNKLYVSEHLKNRILCYHVIYDNDGMPALDDRTVFADLPGDNQAQSLLGPDGMAIDKSGNIFVAQFGGGQVIKYDPSGQPIKTIPCNLVNVTNVAIDPDGALYITMTCDKYEKGNVQKVHSESRPCAA
jgi:gluconolactonase